MNYTIKQKRAYKRFVKGRKQLVHAHKQRYMRSRKMHPMALTTGMMVATGVLTAVEAAEGWRATGNPKDRKKIAYYSTRLPGIRDSIREDYEAGKISYDEYRRLRRRIDIQISRFNSYAEGKQTGRERAGVVSSTAGGVARVTGSLIPIATEYGLRSDLSKQGHEEAIKRIKIEGAEGRKYPWEAQKAAFMGAKAETEELFPTRIKTMTEGIINQQRGQYTDETHGEHDTRAYSGQNPYDKGPGRYAKSDSGGGAKVHPNGPTVVDVGKIEFMKQAERDAAKHGFPPKSARDVEKELGGKKKKNTFF